MKKIIIIIYIAIILLISIFTINNKNNIEATKNKVLVEKVIVNSDKDNDGILDLDDILQGAKIDADNKPIYKDAYYKGGFPPDNEGVCTDVIWRAFKNAGYDLKELVDNDIKENVADYFSGQEKPDPNIDFRRVRNLTVYFKRNSKILTTDIIPNDVNNLKEWQRGDIVVFDKPYAHIAIISDKRRDDGVPYIIHNSAPYTKENDMLIYWNENISKITYHFRFPL